jgi:microcin C transport system substrate-binding protein
MPYIKNLGTLGIEATLRLVDPVQFRARRDDFDFDMIIERFGFSTVPGDSLRPYFSSRAAATKGSNNLAGISDPIIDAMVEQLIAADTRPKLVFAARALDRIIRAGRYWVPQWYANTHRLAYWDVFGHPPNLPKYLGAGVPDLWWSVAKSSATGEQAK